MAEVGMRLSVLPARDGDCLILSYGAEPRRHVVIDGGRGNDAHSRLLERLEAFAGTGDVFELLVVTHFDADHIEGILHLTRGTAPPLAPRGVWFNGFEQVRGLAAASVQAMNQAHADELTSQLAALRWPVNEAFGGHAACLPSSGVPPIFQLPGGLEVALLSPDEGRLTRLALQWEECRQVTKKVLDAGHAVNPNIQVMGGRRRDLPDRIEVEELARTPSQADTDVPNGSSIAFLARHNGRTVLLAADAHPALLRRSLASLLPAGRERLAIDVVKVSHHGSARNTTEGLASLLGTTRFVISTDGSRNQHPNPEAIARLLANAPPGDRVLYFNYVQDWTSLWDNPELQAKHGYRCAFPDTDGVLDIEV